LRPISRFLINFRFARDPRAISKNRPNTPKRLSDYARTTCILWPFALAQLADPDNQRKSPINNGGYFLAHLVH
jgi:hypothetical protein